MTSTNQKLTNAWEKGYLGMVGLDTDPNKIPKRLLEKHGGDKFEAMLEFNKTIIGSTHDLVIGYKINIAFYECYGPKGIEVFNETIGYIKQSHPGLFNIADVKRGDIGNTNEGYTYFLNDFDAMTISPWFGKDANEPFFTEEYSDKKIVVLAKTSNTGSADFQDKISEGLPMYLHVALQSKTWGNTAFVVGATHPSHLLRVRDEIGDNGLILIPGVGKQGGDLKQVILNGVNTLGGGVIINMSRNVIFASDGDDYAQAARKVIEEFNAQVKEHLKLPRVSWKETRPEFYQKRTFKILENLNCVIIENHFVYQSGNHGPVYIAKDKLSLNAIALDEIGMMMADLCKHLEIDTVVAPAVGAIALGNNVAKYLSYYTGKTINSVFFEKSGEKDTFNNDLFKITRGFEEYVKGKKILVVEDIANSGGSAKRIVIHAKENGGEPIAVVVVCNRGNVQPSDIGDGIELINLSKVEMEQYSSNECPLCEKQIPINTTFGHGKSFLAKKQSS